MKFFAGFVLVRSFVGLFVCFLFVVVIGNLCLMGYLWVLIGFDDCR